MIHTAHRNQSVRSDRIGSNRIGSMKYRVHVRVYSYEYEERRASETVERSESE